MLKKTAILTVISVWMMFPAISWGQEVLPGKWWHMPKVKKEISLSDKEKETLDDLYLENRRKLITLKASLETEQLELEALMDREDLDEPAIMAQFQRLMEARTDLGKETFRYILQVRKTIGRERFEELKVLKRKMPRGKHKRPHGFGKHRGEGDKYGRNFPDE